MERRAFLSLLPALGVVGAAAPRAVAPAAASSRSRVITVRGPVAPEEFGDTLMHEHVLVDFVGAGKVSRVRAAFSERRRREVGGLDRRRSLADLVSQRTRALLPRRDGDDGRSYRGRRRHASRGHA